MGENLFVSLLFSLPLPLPRSTSHSTSNGDPGAHHCKAVPLLFVSLSIPLLCSSPPPHPAHVAGAPSMAVSLLPKRSKKTICVFFCEETRALAECFTSESDAIGLRRVNWRFAISRRCSDLSLSL